MACNEIAPEAGAPTIILLGAMDSSSRGLNPLHLEPDDGAARGLLGHKTRTGGDYTDDSGARCYETDTSARTSGYGKNPPIKPSYGCRERTAAENRRGRDGRFALKGLLC